MDGIGLDRLDVLRISQVMEALKSLEENSIVVNTITFTIYDEHKISASRRSKWSALKIKRIVRK